MTEADGRELMVRAQSGDADAFAALYARHRHDVLRWARLRHPQHAEDIAQDVWARALGSIRQWRDQGRPPAAWLYTMTANICADFARYMRVRPFVPVDLADKPYLHEADHASPETVTLDQLIDPALADALQRLKPEHRRVLALRFFGDMSTRETADALGLSQRAAVSLQQRATVALRTLLAEVGE